MVEMAARLFEAGIRVLQVREKQLPDRDLLRTVEGADLLAREFGATVIVDDRVDVARIAALGVHLGGNDLPSRIARELLPADAPVGVSTHDLAAARAAFSDASCDYVAFGPVFDAGADSAAIVGALAQGGFLTRNARRLLDHARRRDPPGRVYLVGFMGSGKTAIGRRISERLRFPFVDHDSEIERTSGLTVRALFEALGEPAFRERESAFLDGTEALPAAVVSTGGGSFVSERTRAAIARLGLPVFLDIPFDAVRERLVEKGDRPLFTSVEQAARLFAERAPFYKMAPVRVALTGRESIEESTDKVLSAVYDRRELGGPRLES